MGRGVRAVWALPAIALVLAIAVIAVGEAGASDARARVRDAELSSLQNEAQQTADAIARRFDEIRALIQASGTGRLGFTNEELVRAIAADDRPRLQEHLLALHRSMPAEVRGLWLGGRVIDPQGYWEILTASMIENVIVPGQGVVRGAPSVGSFDPQTKPGLIYDANEGEPHARTKPYAIFAPAYLATGVVVPILGADGRPVGEIGTDIRMDQLLPELSLPQAAPGKDTYFIDANGRLIRRTSRLLESGANLTTSESIRRVLAGANILAEVEVPLAGGLQLVGHARTPLLAGGTRPETTLDIGWHVLVTRSTESVFADVDAALQQLRLVRLALAGVLLLGGLALGVVLDTAVRQRRELRVTSRQLDLASRHKSEFLANMSHELRTPLNAIIGFSDVLDQRLFGELNERQAEYTHDIASSGRHLLDLVNEILDLSKVEAGKMELEPSEFDLAETVRGAVGFVRERAAAHRIEVATDLPADLGTVAADERKVRQVLLNLLSNAVKFTPDGGTITVRASRTAGEVAISVRDTGIGIAPADQVKVFDEFQQVGKAGDRSREGTGLGLTLAKRFVELHGGRMWVESELGTGTMFTFTIPIDHGSVVVA